MEYHRAIAQAEKELTQLQSKKMESYEAYRSGEISREDFIKVKDQITSQVEALTAKKEQLEKDYQAQLQAKQQARLKQRLVSPKLKRYLPTLMQVSKSICMKQSTELLLQATSK